jgi:phosphoribosylamine--glycine ligase
VATQLDEAIAYTKTQTLPIVLKADGLAAGKGVVIAVSYAEAEQTLREMLLEQKFGEASSKVVIEQFLDGIELSVFVLTDGQSYKILPEAKDYKRIGEGDTGLNTGGMGAVSPVPFADAAFMQKVEERIIKPTIEGLKKDDIDYQGFVFIGLMNVGGDPYVIEYNVRMGDPETEAVVPRITSDLVELLWAAATQNLHNVSLQVTDQVAVAAVLASGGYPENHETGFVIKNEVNDLHTHVFHAGTKLDEAGQVLTNGGRVMVVSALAQDFATARKQAMAAADQISWHNKYFRIDIGQDLEKYFEVI